MAVERDARASRELRYFPLDKWVRGRRGGETVVDSKRPVVVWLPNQIVPVFGFPPEDVRAPSEPIAGLDGYVSVAWDAVDEWLEEEEELLAHARDPFKRIDVRRSSRHVIVRDGDQVLAESRRPTLLFETGLPTRYYLPPEDVRVDLLEPSDTRTTCAYKGHAQHFAHAGRDVAWAYPEPQPDMEKIRDLIAFYNERVDVEVDGEVRKPRWSPFS